MSISSDDNVVAIVQANQDGGIMYRGLSESPSPPDVQAFALSTPLSPGVHSVIVKELDDSGPLGAAHAIGYFLVPEEDIQTNVLE